MAHRNGHPSDLDELARTLEAEPERGVAEAPLLPADVAGRLDAEGDAGVEARALIADELERMSASAADLSDRISRRYFALIDSDAHALAS